ncbi:hypothetical protein [Streptomyces sp. SS]|uniref:hypothetical protein n=1 Tax=Streptomyces sp. SS TaxID=260742 RepID=UPI0002D33845|nr:hypothetical protein [Streptomyces sp. SS]
MAKSKVMENPESRFSAVLASAAGLPGVRIDREAYLRKALARHCSEEDIRRAVEESPAAAGIPLKVLDRAADDSIGYETAKASALSAAAGIPGFIALPATVPADMAQYFGHMLRIAQKLAYLYSWPDLFYGDGDGDGDGVDDATKGVLTLFFGVMLGTQSANAAVGRVASMMSKEVAKKLPQKGLTQGVVYPIVKKVAGYLGVQMTKQTFAKTVSKAIPVVGAVVSGGLTFATYRPMAKRLKKHLAGLELTNPTHRAADTDHADGEVVDAEFVEVEFVDVEFVDVHDSPTDRTEPAST